MFAKETSPLNAPITSVVNAMVNVAVAPGANIAPDGKLVARFFFVADPDGYEIEVLERGGRFK